MRLYVLSPVLAGVGLAGCSLSSGIVPIGPNTYVLSEMRAPVRGGGARGAARCFGRGRWILPPARPRFGDAGPPPRWRSPGAGLADPVRRDLPMPGGCRNGWAVQATPGFALAGPGNPHAHRQRQNLEPTGWWLDPKTRLYCLLWFDRLRGRRRVGWCFRFNAGWRNRRGRCHRR